MLLQITWFAQSIIAGSLIFPRFSQMRQCVKHPDHRRSDLIQISAVIEIIQIKTLGCPKSHDAVSLLYHHTGVSPRIATSCCDYDAPYEVDAPCMWHW